MRYVEIKENVVTNIIEIEPQFIAAYERSTGHTVVGVKNYLDVRMGDAYDAETDQFYRDGVSVQAIAAYYMRGQMLAASDYTQTLDYPCTDAERDAWRTYRQALRDLPEQSGWPDNVVWPEVPTRGKAPGTMQAVIDAVIGGVGNE